MIFERQRKLFLAVMLQDMKTRYGASYSSYLIAIAWPLTHLAVIVVGYLVTNHYVPVGDDPIVFVITAGLPYMLILYPCRFISTCLVSNKPFLIYSPLTPFHLILARATLEFLNIGAVVIVVGVACFLFDAKIAPISNSTLAGAVATSALFGLSLGYLFAVLAAILGVFFTVISTVFLICLYLAAFPLLPEHLLSSETQSYLLYNPMFALIRWFRSAYYPSYELNDVPKSYVFFFSCSILFLGMLAERAFRGLLSR